MELCLLNVLILIVFCVILTLVCSLRACQMWLTRNHMFIRESWGKFTLIIFLNFEISRVKRGRFQNFKKVNLVNFSQTSLLNRWLLIQINGSQAKIERIYDLSIKYYFLSLLNPCQTSVTFQIDETSHMICTANQRTGFYMNSNTALIDYGFQLRCWIIYLFWITLQSISVVSHY